MLFYLFRRGGYKVGNIPWLPLPRQNWRIYRCRKTNSVWSFNYSWGSCLIVMAHNLLIRNFQLFNFYKVRNSIKQATTLATLYDSSRLFHLWCLYRIPFGPRQTSFSASSRCVCCIMAYWYNTCLPIYLHDAMLTIFILFCLTQCYGKSNIPLPNLWRNSMDFGNVLAT